MIGELKIDESTYKSRTNSAKISVAVLAGGRSQRMGFDKAFLEYEGMTFIERITEEMLKISNEILVVIGHKKREEFESVLADRVIIINDEYEIDNPVGGILSACGYLSSPYAAFLACDLPLLKMGVIRFLYESALTHSAAIPMWENGDIEPLCAVYSVHEVETAGREAIRRQKIGCRNLISFLSDVRYVSTSVLRGYDPELLSFLNINDKVAYEQLRKLRGSRSLLANSTANHSQ